MKDESTTGATDAFVAHRTLLFTVAYEILGSASDAEDVLQETWLRWVDVDLTQVRERRAYLARITTRQALNRLRTLQRRREDYVGQWLPEPLLTSPDVAEDVLLAESVSMALMVVLESLAPTERAVFVLRETFDFAYDEIADAVEKSPEAVRQIAHRARGHVRSRRPRRVATPAETRTALEAFKVSIETGDVQALMDVLAPDVVVLADGGGVKQAVPNPVRGADRVARLFVGGMRKAGGVLTAVPWTVNGHPGLLVAMDGELDGVFAAQVQDGRIAGIYYVRNPHKLGRLEEEVPLTRHERTRAGAAAPSAGQTTGSQRRSTASPSGESAQ
ncbi:RNA polymerase sigma-70 factor, ECF subfamily [Georgenia satyanarayanai]|uniref:RNA polymerase sigma-70 factor, ECF subfamily n=1 Tax=Georgenia satyanarayanai TaxID=860221 RepID=A0A2Y9APD1_9MICO|nr:RNA polymerase sigma-70 factor [Georgenia satyanarayanai]PYF98313.1 RNA polymerase sigma-70 factor (ECF subfamily) [Georgenia satyanarayanai]SSA45198.1 RNA polymerase sigma-70 factor, ECF subfamily [Georgenia satyanarayanai]